MTAPAEEGGGYHTAGKKTQDYFQAIAFKKKLLKFLLVNIQHDD